MAELMLLVCLAAVASACDSGDVDDSSTGRHATVAEAHLPGACMTGETLTCNQAAVWPRGARLCLRSAEGDNGECSVECVDSGLELAFVADEGEDWYITTQDVTDSLIYQFSTGRAQRVWVSGLDEGFRLNCDTVVDRLDRNSRAQTKELMATSQTDTTLLSSAGEPYPSYVDYRPYPYYQPYRP
jgi:hypothetical protein